MREIESRETTQAGTLKVIRERYREESGTLIDAFVTACAVVIENHVAQKLIRAGRASGWRFRQMQDFFVELWAPPSGKKAVTYTFRNQVLWRCLEKMGEEML